MSCPPKWTELLYVYAPVISSLSLQNLVCAIDKILQEAEKNFITLFLLRFIH